MILERETVYRTLLEWLAAFSITPTYCWGWSKDRGRYLMVSAQATLRIRMGRFGYWTCNI